MVIKNIEEPYFEQLINQDLIEMMSDAVSKGVYRIQPDGTLKADTGVATESPWHHIAMLTDYNCELWHQVMFDIIGSKHRKFVPSGCQECWKVVVRPRSLHELFQLLDIEFRLQLPSKCGIERRATVHGLYGGYFYNKSLQEGLERYEQIRAEVDKNISPDLEVRLKRACTEFELAFPDSRAWEIHDWQLPIEALVTAFVAQAQDGSPLQPPLVLTHVHRRWIEWAYQNGDVTYLEYTGGKPLYPAAVTYHHLAGKTDEEIEAFTKVNPQ